MTKDGLITPIRVYDVPRMSAGKMCAAPTEEPYLNAPICSIENTRTEAQYLLEVAHRSFKLALYQRSYRQALPTRSRIFKLPTSVLAGGCYRAALAPI